MSGQRVYRNCWVRDWGITGIDDRRIGTRIADGLHNTGQVVVVSGGRAVYHSESIVE
ncbi:hypothetical protein T01_984 [Trichinella spiralis]|uniref:Uncharacterized protein n=1 Tax=Trichinella spiralis TaxID=6334 RepID=A0A0V0ZFU3_TRISP|nr:hypothetical protein T01_984 [Trichinella spiralis]